MKISPLIRATAKTFGMPLDEINRGFCEDFATDVVDYMVSKGELRAIVVSDGWFTKEGKAEGFWRHAWVYFDGRHYDSETPDGVTDWIKLPFFRRCIKKDAELYPDQPKIGRCGTTKTERPILEAAVRKAVAVVGETVRGRT